MSKMLDQSKVVGVYTQSVLCMKVPLLITEVGKNVKQNLESMISKKTEGRCMAEGYIRPGSVRVLSYSSGTINNDRVEFQTVYECMVCYPVEGMNLDCRAKTITKAGVHAEVIDENGGMPITVFIARDHHFTDVMFASIRENAMIKVSVIGVRFELNDPYVCVIAKLLDGGETGRPDRSRKPAIRIMNEA
jgi:DNA-directed RNA polymerase subunit E'/Rpb7